MRRVWLLLAIGTAFLSGCGGAGPQTSMDAALQQGAAADVSSQPDDASMETGGVGVSSYVPPYPPDFDLPPPPPSFD